MMHLSVTGSTAKGKTTTVKVYARTGDRQADRRGQRQGLRLRPQGEDRQDRCRRCRDFKIKPTKSGNIKFAATKPGAIASSVLVAVY